MLTTNSSNKLTAIDYNNSQDAKPQSVDDQLNVSSKVETNPYAFTSVDQEATSRSPHALEDFLHYATSKFRLTSACLAITTTLGLKLCSSGVINTVGNMQGGTSAFNAIDVNSFVLGFLNFGASAGILALIWNAKSAYDSGKVRTTL